MTKRQREKQRQEAKQRKSEKKAERLAAKESASTPDGVDPDIAGIVPGPQPLPDEAAPLDTDVHPISDEGASSKTTDPT